MRANQEISDLIQALGCGAGERYQHDKLRSERVIIMTDAGVDGANIASLLMTFFFREMPKLVDGGRLFLALPPLYRLTQGAKTLYARDDPHKDALMKSEFKANQKIEISRFKGLGEMPTAYLPATTMDPKNRVVLRITLPDRLGGPSAEFKRTVDLGDRLRLPRRAGEDDVARQQGHILAAIAEDLVRREDELARVRRLPNFTVHARLELEVIIVEAGHDGGADRPEIVRSLGAEPLQI